MNWTVFVVVVLALAWLWSGLVKLEIGWRAALTLLGKRTGITLGDGWLCAPFPFGLKEVDCHQKTIKIDPVKDVKTKNGIMVEISGSLLVKVNDVNLYLGEVDQASFQEGIADIWDETIRALVIKMTVKKAQGMKDILANTTRGDMHSHTIVHWGVEVLKVNISDVKTDAGVREDQQRKEREQSQREGQQVQAAWTGTLEQYFLGKEPLTPGGKKGPALSPEMAHELTLYTLEVAEKKKIESKTFGLDPTTAASIAEALAAFKGGRP